MSNILSVDPGFKRLGFALWDKDNNLVHSGAVGPGDRHEDEPWANYLYRGISFFSEWITPFTYNTLVIENLPPTSASANFKSSSQVPLVFAATTVVLVHTRKIKAEVVFTPSQKWKKDLFDDVKITKAQTRRKIIDLYPNIKTTSKISDIPFDQTDAIAIGLNWIR